MRTEQPKQHMSRTYKAVQATQPGKLEVVERTIVEPAFGQVRIRIEACGVCHSDALAVEGGFPGLTYPRVPGHEVVGKIEAIGPGVQGWKEGQRVGVGFMGGHCGHCPPIKPTPTRCPSFQPWTPGPMASIFPTTSWPGTRG